MRSASQDNRQPFLNAFAFRANKPGEVKGESTLTKTGGEVGIRTREQAYARHTLSKRALSTTQPPLQKFAPQIFGEASPRRRRGGLSRIHYVNLDFDYRGSLKPRQGDFPQSGWTVFF